ncbi:hypothetical protein HMPREF0379_2048 [[Eubacterium] yurii subsp. margaretiae ATCC 43715]|nr:hypothetical protein HMPREF0379_2048 [[Eubacterium] yurii subsp. margaretiae ATCC 43715]
MSENSDNNSNSKRKFEKGKFIIPVIIYIIGVVISYYGSREADEPTVLAAGGYIVTSIGIIKFLRAWVSEKYRLGLNIGFPLNLIFPYYPIVEDYDELTRNLTDFKTAYSDFMNSEDKNRDNSKLQNYATQLLWHGIYLQKKRLERLNVQIELITSRRSYSNNASPVRSKSYFDGRYNIDDVNEEIFSTRTYKYMGKNIKHVYDKEVAHYTILSAKSVGGGNIICPNCGNISSRSNFMDGCDYCGTKFTVEDLDSRVGSFGFNRDSFVTSGKREAIKEHTYPWVYMIGITMFFNAGFYLPFFKSYDMDIAMKFLYAIPNAFLFSLAGCLLITIFMPFIVPMIEIIYDLIENFFPDMLYYSGGSSNQEIRRAEEVRKYDPLFSIQSFFGGIQNKLNTVHFADNIKEINAFSDCDLSEKLQQYKDVVDIDTIRIMMDFYKVKDGMQTAMVNAILLIRELKNGKIEERKENVRMYLQKNEDCKTQAVCGPSILKCKSCGSNLSLIDGKKCEFCGQELNMKEHDWVITEYTNNFITKK